LNIESSYKKNNIGNTIYDVVLKYKPFKIIDFGVLYGYSTICMAKALKKLGRGKIYGYDLWDKYKYKHTSKRKTQQNLDKFNVSDIVKLREKDFYKWLKSRENFDLLHIDISNDGDIIEEAYKRLKSFIKKGSIVIFEGGTKERDKEKWVIKYGKKPIYPLKNKIKYRIINNKWPSLSLIER